MRKLLYIICLLTVALSCKRRPLTFDYREGVRVMINADWSDLSAAPTGMSVYCYPKDGGKAITQVANINSVKSSLSVYLPEGDYDILVFNQIPSDFSSIKFEGMDSFATAEVRTVTTTSKWATSKAESDLVRNPDELAAATYLSLVITEQDVIESVEVNSKATDEDTYYISKTIDVTPNVVIKNTRVKVRLSGIHNYRSARATLYGMATGYNFSMGRSHESEATHLLESWKKEVYEVDTMEGEVSAVFSCFGLPLQDKNSAVEDYKDWDGELNIDILLVDNSTIISEKIMLNDKITSTTAEGSKAENTDLDVDVHININTGFGLGGDDDKPIVLPDVTPEGSVGSGFDATIDDWENEESHDMQI